MSDTTTTSPAPAKKMWTRCNGCQQRIYNEPLDIKIHAPLCPQNMLLNIQKLTIAVFGNPNIRKDPDSLTARTARLEQSVGDLDEHITAEPALDPDGIDPDAYTDVVGQPASDDEYETPNSVADATTTSNPYGFSNPTGITADDIAATPWRPNDL